MMLVNTKTHPRIGFRPSTVFRDKVERIFSVADVKFSGKRPWDIKVRNEAIYRRILKQGSIGLGEGYMDGWWECNRLDELFFRIYKANLQNTIKTWGDFWEFLKGLLFNQQKLSRAFQVGQHHYDIGNDLYQCMLDKRLIYSCGYWKEASTLDEAQEAKLELIAQKLRLKPGMNVLDIGCGWGGTAKYFAQRYGVNVVGVTVSKEQVKLAKTLCQDLPIEIRFQDYRSVGEVFDRVVSVGMIEHVGYKNYATFMDSVRRCLKKEGLFLLQTIGINQSTICPDRWIVHHIFPNSMLPSIKQLGGAIERRFVLEDLHNFGPDYDRTLMQWFKNFQSNWHILNTNYDERFYRMWKYFLLSCAGVFRSRAIQLWQLVLSPQGVEGCYRAPR